MAKPVGHKAKPVSKRKREEQSEGDAALAERLAAYGERFLQMFDDHDDRRPAAPPSRPAAHSGSSDSDAGGSSDGSGSGREGGAEAAVDPVEHIFEGRGGKAAARRASNGVGSAGRAPGPRGAGPAGGSGGLPATPQQQQRVQEAARLKAERKRFMSSKPAVVSGSGGAGEQGGSGRRRVPGGTPGSGSAAGGGEAEDVVSRAEFLEMQREVQLYGASALDRKSKKKFEAEMLAKLGAKAAARPRIPASIGHGMARKQAQRDERALLEGIAAGMIQQKGMGKKKRREKGKKVDRGLMEDGGAFRPGILRVKPLPGSGGGTAGGKRRK
ncbi:hypothetical protein CHLNCDRAFT_133205 [Chlorella variabilis]|uniref:Uncharacterized protein n=1 Tax=Chlorella variabilis TaxID=554065 RepID=E1Z2L4_CHLVA|nr:hypothetical protein CHLNCDRAFT_133205 [Chlorella variabilis]EFN59683.1 hypothetical protein CHLNCDRAFT_133205 [Chlorella variabilis]|eukprot:XP_005851785.1 hypothetical protein CHLNCDRAFT_133205 [Chlorella variabilis]